MNTNDTINACGCAEEKKCCATIIKNYYGCGCSGNTGGSGNGHSPYIGENGTWFEWSAEANDFVDTGIQAEGPQGLKGDSSIEYLTTGVETLTNTVLNGKAVYQMLLDLGLVSEGATAGVQVNTSVSLDIANIDRIWIEHAYLDRGDAILPLPWTTNVPLNSPANHVVRRIGIGLTKNTDASINIDIANSTGTSYNAATCHCVIRYTKL